MFQCIAHGHLHDSEVEGLASEFGFKEWQKDGPWPDCDETDGKRGYPILCNRGIGIAVYAHEHGKGLCRK